jgi:hypothetical protein
MIPFAKEVDRLAFECEDGRRQKCRIESRVLKSPR